MTPQAWIGALIVALAGLLLYLSPGQTPGRPALSQAYQWLLPEAGGLKEGDPVKISGVTAGQVLQLDFTTSEERAAFGPEVQVKIHATLHFGHEVPIDSRVSLQRSLTGRRWLEVTPGRSLERMETGRPYRVRVSEALTAQLGGNLAGLRQLTEGARLLQRQLSDPAFRRNAQDMASNMRFYTREFAQATALADSRPAELARSVQEQADQLEALLLRMDQTVSSSRQAARATLGGIQRQASTGARELARVEPALGEGLEQISEQARTYLDLARRVEERTRGAGLDASARARVAALAEQLEEVAGLAGDAHDLTSDPQVQAELRGLVERARQQSSQLKEALEGVDRALP